MRVLCVLLFACAAISSSAQDLSVMTYDLRLDNPMDGRNQWMNRKGNVATLIRKYQPDVVGVQDALHHQLRDLMIDLGQYTYFGVGEEDGNERGSYNAIVYKKDKLQVLSSGTFWLSSSPDVPGSKSWNEVHAYSATWIKFKRTDNGATFIIINTQFDSQSATAQAKSVDVVKKKVLQLAGKLPYIITGDFNMERTDDPYLSMTNGKTLSLLDTKPANDNGGTFCGFRSENMTCKMADYIFIAPYWQNTNYTIIHDHTEGYFPSDHLPVMVTLGVPEP